MKRVRRFAAVLPLAVVLAGAGMWLGGCGVTGTVLTTPGNPVPVADLFPTALLAEPIQLRAGYTHLTQPFDIKRLEQAWNVELGFMRNDRNLTTQQRLDGASNTCWTDSPLDAMKTCKNKNPGLNLRWELLTTDGTSVLEYTYDGLAQRAGGTHAADAITTTLSGFRNQAAGKYRLRVTVLRDFPELDFAKPHILINKPFFRKLP